MNELILTNDKLVKVYVNGIDKFLLEIEKDALNFVADVTTTKGRQQVASQAMQVAKKKIKIDDFGKQMVSEWQRKVKDVNVERKKARDFLDDLKVKVRQPLTQWEFDQAEIKRLEEERLLYLDNWQEAIEMNTLFNKELKLKRKEEELAEQQRLIDEKEKKLNEQIKVIEIIETKVEPIKQENVILKNQLKQRNEDESRSSLAIERQNKLLEINAVVSYAEIIHLSDLEYSSLYLLHKDIYQAKQPKQGLTDIEKIKHYFTELANVKTPTIKQLDLVISLDKFKISLSQLCRKTYDSIK